jgi:hypothetical protein
MKTTLFIFLLLAVPLIHYAQSNSEDTIFTAAWNLENLFDTVNDPGRFDEEFLPGSIKNWTGRKLEMKLYNLARVIRSMNNGRGPEILGVVETEHRALLDNLIDKYLPDLDYAAAYLESPDERGIDNGLIYRKGRFKVLSISGDTVILKHKFTTRLIFNTDLLTSYGDTIHIFVNHWPSRVSGENETEANRIAAATVLRKKVDKLLGANPRSLILVFGDFNDEPTNVSVLNVLKAHPIRCGNSAGEFLESQAVELYNLSYSLYNDGYGTYKYKDDWNMLDQIIVSKELVNGDKFHFICDSFGIYKPYFLVTHSGKYKGTPFPTYGGNKYLGGYSDHFPVTAKFVIKSERGIR